MPHMRKPRKFGFYKLFKSLERSPCREHSVNLIITINIVLLFSLQRKTRAENKLYKFSDVQLVTIKILVAMQKQQ